MARTFYITVRASVWGNSYPHVFRFKVGGNVGEALEELFKETNTSWTNLPPIIKIETHTRKEGLQKIYG